MASSRWGTARVTVEQNNDGRLRYTHIELAPDWADAVKVGENYEIYIGDVIIYMDAITAETLAKALDQAVRGVR